MIKIRNSLKYCELMKLTLSSSGNSISDRSLVGKLCGRLARFMIYSTSREVLVAASTDSTVSKYGFRAVYQVGSLTR